MLSNKKIAGLKRRAFLRIAGLIGATGAVVALSKKTAEAESSSSQKPSITPSAYDLEKLGKVSPELLKYEECGAIQTQSEPKRIDLDNNGILWVAQGKTLTSFNLNGEKIKTFETSDNIRGFYPSNDGLLYVAHKTFIEVYDVNGKRVNKWESAGSKAWLTSITEAGQNIIVTDSGSRTVHKYNKAGKLIGKIDGKSNPSNKSGFVVPSPYFDICPGSDNTFWVVNPGRHKIEEYTIEGEFKRSWGTASFGVEGFCGCCNPSYIAVTSDGKFVTSEKGLARVKVYNPDGSLFGVIGAIETFPSYYKNINSDPFPMDIAVAKDGRILVADLNEKRIRFFKLKIG